MKCKQIYLTQIYDACRKHESLVKEGKSAAKTDFEKSVARPFQSPILTE